MTEEQKQYLKRFTEWFIKESTVKFTRGAIENDNDLQDKTAEELCLESLGEIIDLLHYQYLLYERLYKK